MRPLTLLHRCLTLLLMLGAAAAEPLPPTLAGTGFSGPGVQAFAPQYPLWSDGADKQRWIALPPGQAIDATNPDAWAFPVGTKLWKTFSHGGRPVETRFLERGDDGRWRFATYLWSADGTEATLAPARGVKSLPVAQAPGGRYEVPGRGDCVACHGGAPSPVLGFGAIQLGPDLPRWVEQGLVRGLPAALQATPPVIEAQSAVERRALGHLHGNCGHCHHDLGGQVPLPITLYQRVGAASRVSASLLRQPARFQPGADAGQLVVPGNPAASLLVARMASRDPRVQMPPLGTRHPDPEGLALVERWIRQHPHQEP